MSTDFNGASRNKLRTGRVMLRCHNPTEATLNHAAGERYLPLSSFQAVTGFPLPIIANPPDSFKCATLPEPGVFLPGPCAVPAGLRHRLLRGFREGAGACDGITKGGCG